MNQALFFDCPADELPLERAATDGGYCGILRTVGCIGDSLSSGEMETVDADGKEHYGDLYEYSWGQYMARMTGNTVYNFSRGGMTSKVYLESFAEEHGYWDADKACRAYIMAMGVNDITRVMKGEYEFGSVDDIDLGDYRNNKPTLAGYYGAVLQRYREISPRCRLFLVTPPITDSETAGRTDYNKRLRALLYDIAAKMELAYVIDLQQYGPVYDEENEKRFFLNGHLNPIGYLFNARLITSYIDYIIRHNAADFAQIALVGTDQPYDDKYVW